MSPLRLVGAEPAGEGAGAMSQAGAGPVAVVTGACSGIGLAIAEGLARRGFEVVMVSNDGARLDQAAASLRARQGVVAHTVPLDLARPEGAAELLAAVEALGLEPRVEVLVNNAGLFFFGEVADADPVRANALLQLHVVTPSLTCTLFGRRFRERRRGRILIVSSISAWRDFPGIAYYASSKKYLRGFASALRSELGPYGVGVTCVAPGATLTNLYAGTAFPVERARRVGRPIGLVTGPEPVAEAALAALFAGRAECVPGLVNRVLTRLAALTPQVAVDLIRRRSPWLPLK